MTDHSIYVHLPFCATRCGYCDFATGVYPEIPFDGYARAVIDEIERRKTLVEGSRLISVYLGGGTPSLWPAGKLAEIIAACGETGGIEVTVEVNPGDADPSWFARLVEAGVTRFSVGVQAMDDGRLAWLGRRHDSAQAAEAVRMAREAGVRSVSADIIYGTPGHEVSLLTSELERICDLGVDHVSAYELTVAAGTPVGEAAARGEIDLPDEGAMIDLWEAAGAVLHERGLARYEVSSHGRPGHESVHNQHYWRGGVYLGVGAGAHGHAQADGGHFRWQNPRDVEGYMSGKTSSVEVISPIDRARELVMLGMRSAEGFDLDAVTACLPAQVARQWREIVDDVAREGHVSVEGSRLRPTPSGMLMADGIAELFF